MRWTNSLAIGLLITALASAHPPIRLEVSTTHADLTHARAGQQLVVTATTATGTISDVTRAVQWHSSHPNIVAISTAGYATAQANGTATLTATFAGQSVAASVRAAVPQQPISFRDEILPVLNRAMCNQGACHGTPNGKGGFRLSLRGFDVPFDQHTLTREALGRRVNVQQPDASLLLLKGLAHTPHEGGQRLTPGSAEHRLLRAWVAAGVPFDAPEAPAFVRLEVFPTRRVLRLDAGTQQLRVVAHFADGSRRDVTRLTAFSTSNDDLASVSATGLVTPLARGEVAVLARYQQQIVSARLMWVADQPGFAWTEPTARTTLDRHVEAKLRLLQITPSPRCDDATFLRRAYLDALGMLPTPAEARRFLDDPAGDKRIRLIDALLARPEFTDFWTLKWSDVLRLNEGLMTTDGVQRFHAWIRAWLADDQPLDAFVREILTSAGSTHAVPPLNFFRTTDSAEEMAEVFSQLFLGVRMNCAKCHNHPFERWTQDDYYGLAACFAPVRRSDAKRSRKVDDGKVVTVTLTPTTITHPRTGASVVPCWPTGPSLAASPDPRRPLAGWLTAPDNPFFARALANRIWFHLLGRGVVEPVDDFRDSNPPTNEALLDELAEQLRRGGYRLRPLVRLIMTSDTYQRSATPNPLNRDDTLYFSRGLVRMLSAEQMLDAVCTATAVPETFSVPGVVRAVQLPGAKTDHPFLKVFNRPARNLACECERERESNLAQALQLINSNLVQRKLSDPRSRVRTLLQTGATNADVIEELYLATLTRRPTERERTSLLRAVATGDRQEAFEDLAWSLLNAKEFQFRH